MPLYSLGGIGTSNDPQVVDIAGLTPTDNGVIIGNGTNFVVESGATLKTSLGLTIGTDVKAQFANGQLVGTATNDSASAGNVGEYLETNAANNAVSLSNGAAANLMSLSLTAGDWDVTLHANFVYGATIVLQRIVVEIGTTSATVGLTQGRYFDTQYPASWTPSIAGNIISLVVPSVRLSLANTTTIYGCVFPNFNTDTLAGGGKLSARRMR
jgi:hypothetical protein